MEPTAPTPITPEGPAPDERVAGDTGLPLGAVRAVVALLDDGGTIPFIARYRKEATGGLDEVAIGTIRDRLVFHRELADRKQTVLETIESQGKLTPELRQAIAETFSRTELEDLYAPYRPKRRTRATIARERGLEPLADRMWEQADTAADPLDIASAFIDPEREVATAEDALKGARDILAERIADTPEWRAEIRELTWKEGVLICKAARGKAKERSKFEDYYDFSERVATLPSHRFLAINRGEKEGLLSAHIRPDVERAHALLVGRARRSRQGTWADEVATAARDAYDRLLSVQIETDIRVELKQGADTGAVDVFAQNLRELLLAPPFGVRSVIGIDPGFRTGCKIVVLDATGRLLEHGVVYPTEPRRDIVGTERRLEQWIEKYDVAAVAIGNGTGGRETFAVARDFAKREAPDVAVVLVNESGASVYSASEVARDELPDVDLTVRGAVSIGRRLQDPLAELVKIDPKSIGVGQYQHDVDQKRLKEKLEEVVSSCVNHVGVDVNTASASLLQYVSGLGPALGKSIVAWRDRHGALSDREALLKVPRFGDKTFEQAAGFLRVTGDNPLDNSAVHPERYPLVERMARDLGRDVRDLVGDTTAVAELDIDRYTDAEVGRYTIEDILAELVKPGRDPRDPFDAVEFRDDVHEMSDLSEGMDLPGIVTNVTHFGAFVDIGVHQDGLVHVSEIANRFVRDPAEELKAGQKVRVRVMSVDVERKRIGLSIKTLLPRSRD